MNGSVMPLAGMRCRFTATLIADCMPNKMAKPAAAKRVNASSLRMARAGARHAQRRRVHPLCRRGLSHFVRHTVGDQCGGEPASHSGQGHDAAVHLLWRLLDAVARLRHGHVAGVDPRATARGHADRTRSRSGGERSLMPAGAAPLVLLAAGGTGGHLFPAQALAEVLQKRGSVVELATDTRAAHFKFPARTVHVIPSATLRGRNPLSVAGTGALLTLGTAKAWSMLGHVRPAVVVGFGGYPTVPPLMAAALRGISTVLHEQNGVMGRANRLLAPRVTTIATGFRTLARLDPRLQGKITFTGNPVRREVIAAAATPYAAPEAGGKLRLLVFGGSQGARVMAEIVPAAIERLSADLRARLVLVQQARGDDLDAVRGVYARLGVTADAAPFFSDLPARMAAAHLIVARSGASTVAELSAIGRPAILVPLPHALDQDQFANAGVLEAAGGAIRIEQRDFTPERLAAEIAALAGDPGGLVTMAQSAKSAGTLDAAERLADLVLKVAEI